MSDLAFSQIERARAALNLARESVGGRDNFAAAKNYTRRLIIETAGLDKSSAFNRWGNAGSDLMEKAAVGAVGLSDIDPNAAGILGLVMEKSIVGRLPNLRVIPFGQRMTKLTSGAIAYWTAEGLPRPLSKPALDGDTLYPLTLSALIALTKESLAHPDTESVTLADLVRAAYGALDSTFCSDAAASVGVRPGGIAEGVTGVASTGNLAADLQSLLESFNGDLSTTSIVCPPEVALRIAMASAGNNQIDLGVNGGTYYGLPVLTSRDITGDSNGQRLLLVDAAGIVANVQNIDISQSYETSLAMADNPGAPATMVSLFQTNSVAFLARVTCDWQVSRSGSVAVLEGL